MNLSILFSCMCLHCILDQSDQWVNTILGLSPNCITKLYYTVYIASSIRYSANMLPLVVLTHLLPLDNIYACLTIIFGNTAFTDVVLIFKNAQKLYLAKCMYSFYCWYLHPVPRCLSCSLSCYSLLPVQMFLMQWLVQVQWSSLRPTQLPLMCVELATSPSGVSMVVWRMCWLCCGP